jgi:decaprenyl-phosphate phosphoribosyltransferase
MYRQIIIALRPSHWIKNLLVLAAPFFAGNLLNSEVVQYEIKAFIAFCFASSLGYLVNDWRDREIDRQHPRKKHRPFASNELTAAKGFIVALLLIIGLFIIEINMPLSFVLVVNLYLITTISYSLFLKNIPVVELAALSFGFLLRALGGAAAVDLPVSKWFLIVIGFGSLFVGATKRNAEFQKSSERVVRDVLNRYTESFLRLVIKVSMALVLLAYALWVFQIQGQEIWDELSLIPVTLGVLRYASYQESEKAESPESLILRDPILLSMSVSALTFLSMAIYAT